jgi:hypothetical protein
LFPFAAIITAEFVLRVLYEKPTWWGNVMWGIQAVNVIAIGAVATILLTYVFPTGNAFIFIIFGGLMAVSLASLFSRTRINQIVLSSALAIIAANWVMNTHFYPELFKYQAGKWAANWVDEHEIPKERIFIYPSFGFFSFEYYANHTFYNVDYNQIEQLLENGQDVWIYVKDDYVTNLENKLGRKTEVLASFPAFHISLLTIDFLNPATRDEQLSEQHLVKISAK